MRAEYLTSSFARLVSAQHVVLVLVEFVNLPAFGLVENSFSDMAKEIRGYSVFFRVSPALGERQPAVVHVGGPLRRQTNERD